MNDMEQKRQYYRLKYPRRARPSVRFSDERFHVTEVSEGGIRVVMNNFTSVYKGLSLAGILDLHCDNQVAIEGAVLRIDGGEVVLKLKKGPTFKHMVQEQRHIKNTYPTYFERLKTIEAA
ncbi:PilZ domain-containing protein [Vibrio cholerae]